jgi:hypothetical protein
MIPRDANYEISQRLESGERLLWAGIPRQGIVFRPADWFLVPFSLMWGGFAIFWEASVLVGGAGIFFNIWGIPFVLIGLYLIAGRFVVDRYTRAHTTYGVTDRRIVIVSGSSGRRLKSLSLRTLTDVALDERADGAGTITFGATQPWAAWTQGMPWPGTSQYQVPQFELSSESRSVYNTIMEAQRAAD